MSDRRVALGRHGEALAANYLTRKGVQIIARNYRQKTGEIDIIARDGDYLVFIEVKTRKSSHFGHPFEAVTRKKQAQISRVALGYMGRNKLLDQPARFDVISIVMKDNGQAAIEHLTNCFELENSTF